MLTEANKMANKQRFRLVYNDLVAFQHSHSNIPLRQGMLTEHALTERYIGIVLIRPFGSYMLYIHVPSTQVISA